MVAKSVISSQAGQSAVNRIGKAGEGGRESCAASPGAATGHPRPQDAVAAIRVGKSPRRLPDADMLCWPPLGVSPTGKFLDTNTSYEISHGNFQFVISIPKISGLDS